jgi:ABC-2 type transport system ATP-binding protein
VPALRELELTVPEGALYALLGANGSGKTTLLKVLMGLLRPTAGRARVMGVDSTALTVRERERIGYIAEGQSLPPWMRLSELEAYLRPLYSTWDAELARHLRQRFELDPTRRIGALSRGQAMKVALLCALAPRPRLLVMDEPFTGMDAVVKDDLVHGLLDVAGSEGWSVLICSHDIGELELLADWVGLLDAGRMRLSEPMDVLRGRFKRAEVVLADGESIAAGELPGNWLSVERAGQRLGFLVPDATTDLQNQLHQRFPHASRIEVRAASLREVFVGLVRGRPAADRQQVAA